MSAAETSTMDGRRKPLRLLAVFLLMTSSEGYPSRYRTFHRDRGVLGARGKGQKERARLRENPEPLPVAEFSRSYSSEQLGKGRTITVDAKPEERKALSLRFGVDEISALEATLTIQDENHIRHAVFLHGAITGMVVQACAISGVPVPSSIETDFDCVLLVEGGANAAAALAEDGDYDVEEIEADGMVDLGEIVSQYFALEISTYPVAPGATLPERRSGK